MTKNYIYPYIRDAKYQDYFIGGLAYYQFADTTIAIGDYRCDAFKNANTKKKLAFLTVFICGLYGRDMNSVNDHHWIWSMPSTKECIEAYPRIRDAFRNGGLFDIISREDHDEIDDETGDVYHWYQTTPCTINLMDGYVIVREEKTKRFGVRCD